MDDILSDVQIEPPVARKRNRLVAAMIDSMILSIIYFLLVNLFGTFKFNGEDGAYWDLDGFPALLYFAAYVALIPVQEGVTGKTIGKRLLKLKVIKPDGSRISIGQSILRHLFDMIDCIFLIGLIVASRSPKNQRIGDRVAGTIVIAEGYPHNANT